MNYKKDTIQITTQKEFDKIPDNYSGKIEIIGNLERVSRRFSNAYISVSGSAVIKFVHDSAVIESVSGSAVIESVPGSAVIESVYDSAVIESVPGSTVIESVSGSAVIESVYDSAVIESVSDSAVIESVSGSAVIESVYDSAVIESVYDSAVIESVYDSAVIESVSGSTVIESVSGSAVIESVYGSAVIKSVYGSAVIEFVSGSAVIKSVYDSAVIATMFGLASVLFVSGRAVVNSFGRNIVRNYKSEKEIKLKLSKETTHVILPDIKMNLREFQIQYPHEKKGNDLILYKAVHKIGGRYFSDYQKDFEYKIGEVYKNELVKEGGACGTGLHISHKRWAVGFGRDWEDMALLECLVGPKDCYVAADCDGKIRTSKLTVLREVPKNEY